MSEHCWYLTFPDDGKRDPVIVETHPFSELVSDDLGGAVPISIPLHASRAAMFVREDAATTGYGRNLVASVIATMLSDWRRTVLVIGPAVLTTLIPTEVNPETGKWRSIQEGFTPETATGLALVAADIRAAIDGSDGPFSTEGLMPGWADKVREFAGRLAATPIAEDWPLSEGKPPAYDHISAALEAAFPGRQYLPFRPLPVA